MPPPQGYLHQLMLIAYIQGGGAAPCLSEELGSVPSPAEMVFLSQGPAFPLPCISLPILPPFIKGRDVNTPISRQGEEKEGLYLLEALFLIASPCYTICSDYQINHQIAKPIK